MMINAIIFMIDVEVHFKDGHSWNISYVIKFSDKTFKSSSIILGEINNKNKRGFYKRFFKRFRPDLTLISRDYLLSIPDLYFSIDLKACLKLYKRKDTDFYRYLQNYDKENTC